MKIRNVIKLLLLVAVLCIGGSWWYFEVYSKRVDPMATDNEGIIQEELTALGETLQSGIRELGELNTAEYYFSRVETVESTKKIDLTSIGINFIHDIPLTTNSFSYSYDGEIKAGIDFSEVRVEKDVEKKQLTVILPQARILSSVIDPDSYVFYEVKNNILNPIDPQDYAVSFAELVHAEEERAVEKGILDRANENAVKMIRNFVGSYASGEYKITVKTGE